MRNNQIEAIARECWASSVSEEAEHDAKFKDFLNLLEKDISENNRTANSPSSIFGNRLIAAHMGIEYPTPDNLGKHSQRQPRADGGKTQISGKGMAKSPVLYNRMNLSDELNMSKNKIFRAYAAGIINADAFMCDGQPLFFACRVTEIRMLLNGQKI